MSAFLEDSDAERKLAELSIVCLRAYVASHEVSYDDRVRIAFPIADSPLANDVTSNGLETAGQVQQVTSAWSLAAADCVGGLHHIFQGPALTFAPAPLARAALEYGAAVDWVLERTSGRSRCVRAWLANLISCGQDVVTADREGALPGTLGDTQGRLAALRDEILPRLFGRDAIDTKGRPEHWKLAGETMPNRTAMVDRLLEERLNATHGAPLYRVISSAAHPTTSGTFPFIRETGDNSAEVKWSFDHTFHLTNAALSAWWVAAKGYSAYVGLEAPELDDWNRFAKPILARLHPRASEDNQA